LNMGLLEEAKVAVLGHYSKIISPFNQEYLLKSTSILVPLFIVLLISITAL